MAVSHMESGQNILTFVESQGQDALARTQGVASSCKTFVGWSILTCIACCMAFVVYQPSLLGRAIFG